MHSLTLILAAAAIGLGLSVADRNVAEPVTYHGHATQHAALLSR